MASIPRSNTKAPAEVRDITMDYTGELATGEIITGATVAVYYNTSPPTNVGPGDLVASGPTIVNSSTANDAMIACVLSLGAYGTDYLVTFTATTSLGQVIPRSIMQFVGQT